MSYLLLIDLFIFIYLFIYLLIELSAVRAVSWGEGNNLFATASDPFRAGELGAIAIFDFPDSDSFSSVTAREESVITLLPKLEIQADEGDYYYYYYCYY
jgi:hypothetical protein